MDVDPLSQRGQCGTRDAFVGELVEQRRSVGERDREHVVDAELALQTRARVGQPGRRGGRGGTDVPDRARLLYRPLRGSQFFKMEIFSGYRKARTQCDHVSSVTFKGDLECGVGKHLDK
jgi:hypothetical protein